MSMGNHLRNKLYVESQDLRVRTGGRGHGTFGLSPCPENLMLSVVNTYILFKIPTSTNTFKNLDRDELNKKSPT